MRVVVLLSGGQDSTTSLYWAKREHEVVGAVSIDYGQRHRVELMAAQAIARVAGVPWQLLHCPALSELADSALVNLVGQLSNEGGREDAVAGTLPTSYVPARNAVLLALAAGYAVKQGAEGVVTGVCQTDYSGYPDCREDFIEALELALNLGLPSSTPLRLITPLMHLDKVQTVQLAAGLEGCLDALSLSITCYNGERPGCGVCPACMLRAKGFEGAGIADPSR